MVHAVGVVVGVTTTSSAVVDAYCCWWLQLLCFACGAACLRLFCGWCEETHPYLPFTGRTVRLALIVCVLVLGHTV